MFIPSAIRELLIRREFHMTSGEQRRDFIYVDDVVEAFLRIARCKKAPGEVFNVGSGAPCKIADVIDIITNHIGGDLRIVRGAVPCRKGEGPACYCDNRKLREFTGWAPRVSLEEGLRRTIAWYRQYYAGEHGSLSPE